MVILSNLSLFTDKFIMENISTKEKSQLKIQRKERRFRIMVHG